MNGAPYYRAHTVWLMLKITYGLLFVAAGIDKYFNMLTRWGHYLSPIIVRMLPVSVVHFMYAIGAFEIVIGLLILTNWTKQGAYLATAWLLVIAAGLLTMRMFYDIAVSDIVMAVGAYALALLSA